MPDTQTADPTASLKSAIQPWISGHDVLDVGSINHVFAGRDWRRGWIFDFVQREAAHVLGIDIEAEQVAAARDAGYNIEHGDAETWRAERPFDVVLASDLIEHLSNPGLFLDRARENLKPGGRLVLATPNAFCLREFFMVVSRWTNDPEVHWQHVCYHTPTTLKALAARAGFRFVAIRYVNIRYAQMPWKDRALQAINRGLCRVFPKFSHCMVLVFERP
jgi:SAM-dependent methyltransferase